MYLTLELPDTYFRLQLNLTFEIMFKKSSLSSEF